jgi:tetratricopeptide (TPR) repeat protein
MNKNIFVYCLTLVMHSTALAQEPNMMSEALKGKIAYMQGNYQAAYTPLLKVLLEQPDQNSYLQYFHSTLHTQAHEELYETTKHLVNHHEDLLYRKARVVLDVRYHALPPTEELDLLSKDDWYQFFSMIPNNDRLVFLEKLYQPAMVHSSSTRAFMAEILNLLELRQESVYILSLPTHHLNRDLINTSQHLLSIRQLEDFLMTNQESVKIEDQESWFLAITELYKNRSMPENVKKKFISIQPTPTLAEALISNNQFDLAKIFIKGMKEERLFIIQLELVQHHLKRAEHDLKNYKPKNSSRYQLVMAEYHYQVQHYPQALEALNSIEDQNLFKQKLILQTKILLKTDPKTALRLVTQLQQKGLYLPREAIFYQALALSELGYQPQAILMLERLHEHEPDYIQGTLALANLYLCYQDNPTAARQLILDHFDEKELSDTQAAMILAQSHLALGLNEEALLWTTKAMMLKADKQQMNNMIKIFEQTGCHEKVSEVKRLIDENF